MATETTTFVSENRDQHKALVVVFLRGGADGLSLVPPLEDDDYYGSRPTIAIDRSAAVKLDDFFGLNPNLAELAPAYREGALSIIHCAGSEDGSRSHFEAQDLMEHGGQVAGGWLGRFLRYRSTGVGTGGPLAAVAMSRALPMCLRGAPAATAIRSLREFSLGEECETFKAQLARLYGLQDGLLGDGGRDTLDALRRIDALVAEDYRPANGAEYADDDFSQGLRRVAHLVRARVGLEAASVDIGGWDSHLTQSSVMDPKMIRLSQGLSSFHRDLGRDMDNVTVVVMTEFGRRVRENSALGTDHGRGSVMFVLGGGFNGGKVHADWPGLKSDSLEGPGDLPVVTNYRNVLAPVLKKLDPELDLGRVFPEFEIAPFAL